MKYWLEPPGYGDMIVPGRTKADRLRALHVCSNHIQAAFELTKIIRAAKHGEGALQVLVQPLVIEKSGRCRLGQNGHGFQQALVVRVVHKPG